MDDLYLPLDLGYLPSSGDVLIFDGHCNRLFTLDLSAVASSSAESWRYVRGGDYIDRVSFQGDCLLTGLYCENQDMMLAVETLGDDDSYRRIIPVSRPLQAHLDSVGLGYTSSMAAVDPSSGRIWVVICDYDYILVSTGDGLVVDSAHICSPDYVSARPPLSRVKSQAVWEQWMRSRTYKTAFKYVAPGYFILQYDVSHNAPDHEGKMSFGTSVWNTRIEPIHVDIDPTWQLAGACDDGRLIFGRFAMQDSSRYFEYIFAEIEP